MFGQFKNYSYLCIVKPKKQTTMTRETAINLLKKTACKYAVLTIDVWSVGKETTPCYPNEKVIVSVMETQDQTKFYGKAYTTFESIREFREHTSFGLAEARKNYNRYYFGNIAKIEYKY